LVARGSIFAKLLALATTFKNIDKTKEKLLKEIQAGKAVKEFHTKAGNRFDNSKDAKRDCKGGKMTLSEDGQWVCYAVWKAQAEDNTPQGNLIQATFRVVIDADPSKTTASLLMTPIGTGGNIPHNAPATTFTVVDYYFKYDTDGSVSGLSIAGELGVTYHDLSGAVRTIKFTTGKDKAISFP
jgi:hypothetical protein